METERLTGTYGYYPSIAISFKVARVSNSNQDNMSSFSSVQTTSNNFFFDVPWLNMTVPIEATVAANVSEKFTWTAETSPTALEAGGSTKTINGYLLEYSKDAGATY